MLVPAASKTDKTDIVTREVSPVGKIGSLELVVAAFSKGSMVAGSILESTVNAWMVSSSKEE
jgi:hypothetical protein